MTEHFITLSTTEPNNNIGIVKLRHADVNSQSIVAQIVENGQPKSFDGLQPFFCLMAQEVTGQGVTEEPVKIFNSAKGTLEYTTSDNALQFVGRNEAYFSFRKQVGEQWFEQFSTRTFHYIVEKSIYSQPFKDSNYWWTFKELNRIFKQYIEDGRTSWEEFVEANREILESTDPGGKVLSELIESRNDSDGEAFGNLSERLKSDSKGLSQLDDLELGGSAVRSEFQSAIENLKNSIAKDKFSFAIGTDFHADDRLNPRYPNGNLAFSHFTNTLDFDGAVDAIIINGDNIDAMYSNLDRIKQETKSVASKILDRPKKSDIFINLGNHDDGSGRGTPNNCPIDGFIKYSEFQEYYRTTDLLNGEVREDGNSLYYYKDYKDKKIRLIGLYTEDIDETQKNDAGFLKHTRWLTHTIRQKQLDWIANTALKNVPQDYHVVIVGHCPLYYGWTDTGAMQVNHQFQKGVFKAFKEGEKYSESTGADTDFPLVANYDFTSQGPRNLVGFFAGHTHRELITNWDGVNIIHCMHSIGGGNDVSPKGTIAEEAQTIVEIDTSERKVKLSGIGRATNREFTY